MPRIVRTDLAATRTSRSKGLPGRPARRLGRSLLLVTLVATVTAAPAWARGRKVWIKRKYRPGQSMVYEVRTKTQATLRTRPEGLKAFLPPLPEDVSTRQQNTLTVRTVSDDGGAEIENRLDLLEIRSSFSPELPKATLDSMEREEEELSKQLSGASLALHYDAQGRLVKMDGADEMLKPIDPPFREPLVEALKFLVELMSGGALYPGHPVEPNEEWRQNILSPPPRMFPFDVKGGTTMRFVGKAKVGRVKAAMVDYRFDDVLTPRPEKLREMSALGELEGQGIRLDMRVEGQGQGRVYVAFDDGRILEHHSTVHQVLTLHLKAPPTAKLRTTDPISLELTTDAVLEIKAAGE